jgi:hypothetical protein
MDNLSDGEVTALRNLAQKREGVVTAFINISDARHLTDLGLATRSRQGWDITAAGSAHLRRLGGHDGDDAVI